MVTELINTSDQAEVQFERWDKMDEYRIRLQITHEDGAVTVVAVDLPGVGSQGSSESEAVANVREAIQGVLDSYLSANEEIPWNNVEDYKIPEGSKVKWINVNA